MAQTSSPELTADVTPARVRTTVMVPAATIDDLRQVVSAQHPRFRNVSHAIEVALYEFARRELDADAS